MNERVQSTRYRLLADHLGTGITLSYLALVAIGMFHSVLGYRHFGINILDYAEASDFFALGIEHAEFFHADIAGQHGLRWNPGVQLDLRRQR